MEEDGTEQFSKLQRRKDTAILAEHRLRGMLLGDTQDAVRLSLRKKKRGGGRPRSWTSSSCLVSVRQVWRGGGVFLAGGNAHCYGRLLLCELNGRKRKKKEKKEVRESLGPPGQKSSYFGPEGFLMYDGRCGEACHIRCSGGKKGEWGSGWIERPLDSIFPRALKRKKKKIAKKKSSKPEKKRGKCRGLLERLIPIYQHVALSSTLAAFDFVSQGGHQQEKRKKRKKGKWTNVKFNLYDSRGEGAHGACSLL